MNREAVRDAVLKALNERKNLKFKPSGTVNRVSRAGLIRRLMKRLEKAGMPHAKAETAAYDFANKFIPA